MNLFETKQEFAEYLTSEGIDTSAWKEDKWEEFAVEIEPTTPNLTFPAEYNIQDLAIKMRAAMNASKPTVLSEGDLHLPFVTEEDLQRLAEPSPGNVPEVNDYVLQAIKISAARCAMTSYSVNKGKTLESELDLANRLLKDNHMSPFEHQAQAVENLGVEWSKGWTHVDREGNMWSANLLGWKQARHLIT